MSRRRPLALTLAAVFAALTLFATACSSSDKADDSRKTTTTAEKDSKSSDSSKSSEPTTTLDDGAFSAEVSKAEESLAAAGKDPCKVMTAFQGSATSLGAPGNATQRKQVGMLQISFLRAIADAAPSDLSKEAATLRDAADKVQKEGEQTNWSEDFMKGPKSLEKNTAYSTASSKLVTAIGKQCVPSAGGAPTDSAPATP